MILPSVLEILKPAVGPSSSHTLGPLAAARDMRARLNDPRVERVEVVLYGSLAQTGRGHLTDVAVSAGLAGYWMGDSNGRTMRETYEAVCDSGRIALRDRTIPFLPERDIRFDVVENDIPHPNTLRFNLLDSRGRLLLSRVYLSIGGGRLVGAIGGAAGRKTVVEVESTTAIIETCNRAGLSLVDYVIAAESEVHGVARGVLEQAMSRIWRTMIDSIDAGLTNCGILPGGLELDRRAAALYERYRNDSERRTFLSANATRASIYAIAVAEENAAGGAVVTAPTCGSSGVLPACLRVMQESRSLSDERIHEALLVAGLIGAAAVGKASIAGALVGCQGEIGVASAMAAAAVCYLLGGDVEAQIDRAAETALEHYLGLTCDPVGGLVQIPCIERNAAGAVSAFNAAGLAMLSGGRDRVSFDATLEAMHQTGLDMPSQYKETSLGGLAAIPDLDRDGSPDLQAS